MANVPDPSGSAKSREPSIARRRKGVPLIRLRLPPSGPRKKTRVHSPTARCLLLTFLWAKQRKVSRQLAKHSPSNQENNKKAELMTSSASGSFNCGTAVAIRRVFLLLLPVGPTPINWLGGMNITLIGHAVYL
jgi:hypothetical protein